MKLFYAKFFDARGDFIGNKRFKKFESTFKYKNRRYNVEMQKGSYYETTTIPFILFKRFYIYNLEDPNPIKLDKKSKPILEPEIYNTIIESEEAKKLNNLHKKGLLANLDMKTIMIILGIIAGAIYFLQGGTITG